MDFLKICSEYGIELNNDNLIAFEIYTNMLTEKNKVMNLTAITEPDEIYLKHYLDSMLPLKADCLKKAKNIIDVGCGAGFPSIPLKIMLPETEFTLLDSLNKRLIFIDEVIAALNLKGIKTVHMRAEDGGREENMRDKFDVCVARAVASMKVLIELCSPFIRPGGSFVALKGKDVDSEISSAANAAGMLGLKFKEKISCNLPQGDERNIIIYEKISHTSPRFPRKAPKPSKTPL